MGYNSRGSNAGIVIVIAIAVLMIPCLLGLLLFAGGGLFFVRSAPLSVPPPVAPIAPLAPTAPAPLAPTPMETTPLETTPAVPAATDPQSESFAEPAVEPAPGVDSNAKSPDVG